MGSKPAPKKNKGSNTKPSASTTAISAMSPKAIQDQKAQQTLLNIFSDAFANVLQSDRFPTLLQEIKQALFNRDFATAFSNEEYLHAYAARWSPTRTLCYATVFLGIRKHADLTLNRSPSGESRLRMLSVGGCAAEHVAFASYLELTNTHGDLTLLDAAPWTHVSSILQEQLTTAPVLSKYASAAAKAANKALLEPHQMVCAFTQADVLALSDERLAELVGSQPVVVTLMFTLNELYTEGGIGKTTKFLRALGRCLPEGSLLLVVDSPGSYSEAAVGKEKKRYPMQWLLNHTLLEGESTGYTWEQLESEDSIWFRLPEGLSYPIQLENMRYQMHLYRVHKDTPS